MIAWLIRQVRYFVVLLRTHDSPRQLALGFAFGILLGLVPKGNLLAVLLLTLFFSLKINLAVGMLTAAAVSYASPSVDAVAHRIGYFLLTHPALREAWITLYNTPVVPWTRFNNTIVLGATVLGTALFYPSYRLSLPIFERVKRVLRQRAEAARKRREEDSARENASHIRIDGGHETGKTARAPHASSELLVRSRHMRFRKFLEEIDSLSRAGRVA